MIFRTWLLTWQIIHRQAKKVCIELRQQATRENLHQFNSEKKSIYGYLLNLKGLTPCKSESHF